MYLRLLKERWLNPCIFHGKVHNYGKMCVWYMVNHFSFIWIFVKVILTLTGVCLVLCECLTDIFVINSRLADGLRYASVTMAFCTTLHFCPWIWKRFCFVVVLSCHDDVIKWKHLPRYWPFVRGIHRSPVNSPHKGQWRGALMFTLICARIKGWVNNREAGDLRRYRGYYDVTVMFSDIFLHLSDQQVYCLLSCDLY